MLEPEDYRAVDTVFPFIAAFIERGTAYTSIPLLATAQMHNPIFSTNCSLKPTN